jgi:glucuronoarabinoxylan endo-1,4-beta-xylanase
MKRIFLIGLLSLMLIFTAIGGNVIFAASNATVYWNTLKQPIDGFGVSEAFHQSKCINQFPEPKRTEILDLLFSTTKGSGFSILRNMVGDGGTWGNATDGPLPSIEPSEGVWSWNESNDDQIPLMNTLKTNYGVTRFMSTVWSPPAWMKSNNSVANGGTCKTDKYQAFADYLAEYVNGYKSHFGIDIYAISMTNEPDMTTAYSSCTWSAAQISTFIANYVKPTFQSKNVPALFMAGEHSNFTESPVLDALNNSTAASRLDIVGAHSYGGGPTWLSTSKNKGKKIWETEVSNLSNNDASINDGLSWAKKCHDFMVTAEINAFFYWWGACYKTNNGEGLIRMDMNAKTYSADKRLYTIGNFSRFVRPGWNRIDATASPASNVSISAYKESSSGKFAIVAINQNGSSQDINFNLSGFNCGSITPYRTSGSENLAQLSAVSASSGSFTYTLTANSVTSFVGTAGGSVTPTPTPTIGPGTPTPTPTPGSGSISIACGRTSALGSFQADQYYSGGSTYANSNTIDVSQITSNPPPAALFNNERYGAMSYTIPGFTAGNSYTVTLYFAETYVTSSGSRRFNVSINGATVLSNFDIYATAGGQNKAIARPFTATANSSGQIVIQFTSVTENPKINGISIQPGGNTPTPTPTRVNTPTPTPTRGNNTPTPTPTPGRGSISIAAGSTSAVGSFQADQYYSGGRTYRNSNTVSVSGITSNPPPAALFNNERYGAMSYTIPGFTAGNSYTVTLYFAETYLTASGRRLFSVSINGATVLSNFDIYASAGGQNKAIARSFTTTANASGQIVIQFISATENPKINGISIQ